MNSFVFSKFVTVATPTKYMRDDEKLLFLQRTKSTLEDLLVLLEIQIGELLAKDTAPTTSPSPTSFRQEYTE